MSLFDVSLCSWYIFANVSRDFLISLVSLYAVGVYYFLALFLVLYLQFGILVSRSPQKMFLTLLFRNRISCYMELIYFRK